MRLRVRVSVRVRVRVSVSFAASACSVGRGWALGTASLWAPRIVLQCLFKEEGAVRVASGP